MAANVTISHGAWSDPRIHYLAQMLETRLTDAVGRLALLWSRCTELQTDRPGRIEIRACIGPRGDELLLEAGLAEEVKGGDLRVRGTDGRIGWFGDVKTKRANGGKARAANAPRDHRGRLLSSKHNAGEISGPASVGMLDNAGLQQSSTTHIAGSSNPASSSRSESGSETDLPEREAAAQKPSRPELSGQQTPAEISPGPVASTDGIGSHGSLGDEGLASLNAIRARLAKRFGWTDLRPLHPMDPCRTDLSARLREAGDQAAEQLAHVLRIAELEAVAKKTSQYLGGGIFSERSWSKKLAMREADVMRAIGGDTGPTVRRVKPRSDDDMPPMALTKPRPAKKPDPPEPTEPEPPEPTGGNA